MRTGDICFCYEVSGECIFVTKFRVETFSKEKVVLNLCRLTNTEGDIVSVSAVLRRPEG